MAALKKHCESEKPLRVLTTTYTGSTEERALDELQQRWLQLRSVLERMGLVSRSNPG